MQLRFHLRQLNRKRLVKQISFAGLSALENMKVKSTKRSQVGRPTYPIPVETSYARVELAIWPISSSSAMVLDKKTRTPGQRSPYSSLQEKHCRSQTRSRRKGPKILVHVHKFRHAFWTAALLSPTLVLLSSVSSDAVTAKGYTLHNLPSEKSRACVTTSAPHRLPTYVFLHLHKTGGNNLKLALYGFAKRNNLLLYHTCRPSQADSWLKAWWFHRKKVPGVSEDCNLDDLAQQTRNLRNTYDLIVGHQYFGVHRLLRKRDVKYFTIVRHPLARKVSHFAHFENRKPSGGGEHNKYRRIQSRDVDKSDMEDLESLATYIIRHNRNYMVKRLSGTTISSEIVSSMRSWYIDVNPFGAKSALRSAQRNLLDRFFFVGVQERYDESMCVLAAILNAACFGEQDHFPIKKLDPAKISSSKANSRGTTAHLISTLPTSVRLAALQAENLDMELYIFANRLLDGRLREYSHCSRFEVGRTPNAK
jgi:hypothetical protein